MRRQASNSCLSAIFIDYDNIYLSLKRKNEDAAKRFAKDTAVWLKQIETGSLITPTSGLPGAIDRRIVMNRCYGNPVPRRNSRDNATDMNSFPFVRHNFLRAGSEIVDCPPLTAQLKNSSDIRMVMDVRDFLTHETYFDEFIILSGDADFTPVLHRLRAHARRTVIYANEYTATPYTAICDGEIRESDLIQLLLEGSGVTLDASAGSAAVAPADQLKQDQNRAAIIAEVVNLVRAAQGPVPIETLADHAQRTLGHDQTIGTSWAGFGAFRTFLLEMLPEEIQLSDQAPYVAFEVDRFALDDGGSAAQALLAGTDVAMAALDLTPLVDAQTKPQPTAAREALSTSPVAPAAQQMVAQPPAVAQSGAGKAAVSPAIGRGVPVGNPAANPANMAAPAAHVARTPSPQTAAQAPQPSTMQQSIARIHDACQAPPLAPAEYRKLFELIAGEINQYGLSGAQTVTNIVERAKAANLDARRDDVRFVLDVVSEADPWFEQGASANLFAGRFRNFVVARCRSQGLNLTASELDLVDAWFAGGNTGSGAAAGGMAAQQPIPQASGAMGQGMTAGWPQGGRGTTGAPGADAGTDIGGSDVSQLPRVVRTRMPQ